jgi:regulator of protease activity HflC (stomatin/prohibitin superfamily)
MTQWNTNQPQREQEPDTFGGFIKSILKKKSVWIPVLVIFALLIVLIVNPLVIIGPGKAGVVMNMGQVQERVLPEGMNFIIPIYQSVYKMDCQVHKAESDATASSKDIQDVHAKIAVNYYVEPAGSWWVYKHLGTSFKERVIDPQVQEIFKAVTAQYTAAELITKREAVSQQTKEHLKARFLEYHLILDNLSIVNFAFSPAFTKAVEEKQVAEQEAKREFNNKEKEKNIADQKIESARGEAESLKLKNQQLTAQIIQYEAIKKWDGKLPTYMGGGAVPFINVEKVGAAPKAAQ